jgi:hypothetical protein
VGYVRTLRSEGGSKGGGLGGAGAPPSIPSSTTIKVVLLLSSTSTDAEEDVDVASDGLKILSNPFSLNFESYYDIKN